MFTNVNASFSNPALQYEGNKTNSRSKHGSSLKNWLTLQFWYIYHFVNFMK